MINVVKNIKTLAFTMINFYYQTNNQIYQLKTLQNLYRLYEVQINI